VRYLSGRAKIETSVNDIADVAAMRSDIISGIKSCGFKGVLLDLEGYRQGSLNEDINTAKQ
jgi:PP-loop superfamily ATP-utilizing enzyme